MTQLNLFGDDEEQSEPPKPSVKPWSFDEFLSEFPAHIQAAWRRSQIDDPGSDCAPTLEQPKKRKKK